MTSRGSAWVTIFPWVTLTFVGVVYLLEGDVVTGTGFLVGGPCGLARLLASENRRGIQRGLSVAGGAGCVLALIGIAM